MKKEDIIPSRPCKIVGYHQGKIIFLHTYPTHIEIRIGENTMTFRNYQQAMEYLRQIAMRYQKNDESNKRTGRKNTV